MEIEHVAGIRLASGRAADQQGQCTVSDRVLGKVVIDNQRVLALIHKILAHCTARIGRDILQRRKLGRRRGDDDSIVHRAVFLQGIHQLRDRRALLPDGDIDAGDTLSLLVDDGIGCNDGLARLTVADDQLTLTSADRDHGVDRLDTGLQRDGDALTFQDAGRGRLDGRVLFCIDGTLAVDRLTQCVDDTTDQLIADGNGHDTTRAANSVALADAFFVAEHDDGNGVFLQVLRHAVHAAGEFQQLVDHAACQSGGFCDAVADQNDRAGLRLVDLCFIVFDLRTDDS